MTHHLVGAAEIAAILGVSRQRVSQLAATDPEFPAPEVELASGRVWVRESVEQWASTRTPRQREAIMKNLTEQEVAVIGLVAARRNVEEVAETLLISQRTVGNHLRSIAAKLGELAAGTED